MLESLWKGLSTALAAGVRFQQQMSNSFIPSCTAAKLGRAIQGACAQQCELTGDAASFTHFVARVARQGSIIGGGSAFAAAAARQLLRH